MRWLPLGTLLCVVLLLASLPWLRLNLSPSVPLGFYRLHQVPASLTYGQLVLVDVPETLRPWWPRRMPLLKPVAGLPGDVLDVWQGHFYINAVDYGPVFLEAAGMPLPQWVKVLEVPPGAVCLATPVVRSLDCRYTGPIPQAALKAMATPFWTWD